MLNELLTNAFRHGFADGRSGAVTIRIHTSDHRVHVQVEDNGVGSAQAPKANVVGSGRSIVAALVGDELGGTVNYNSDVNGTRVTLEFPSEA